MNWPVYDAKARFSELLDTAIAEGPQIVTRRGVEAAVLVPIDEWKRVSAAKQPSLKDPLLDPNGPILDGIDFAAIRRQLSGRRQPPSFDE